MTCNKAHLAALAAVLGLVALAAWPQDGGSTMDPAVPAGTPPNIALDVTDNWACLVCHLDFETETLTAQHADVGISCSRCHGPPTPISTTRCRPQPPTSSSAAWRSSRSVRAATRRDTRIRRRSTPSWQSGAASSARTAGPSWTPRYAPTAMGSTRYRRSRAMGPAPPGGSGWTLREPPADLGCRHYPRPAEHPPVALPAVP